MKWLVFFLGSMAILFAVIAIASYCNTSKLLSEGGTASGTVVRLQLTSSGVSNSRRVYNPVIRFNPEGKEAVEEMSKFGSYPPEFKEGQAVEILYEKKNPKNWTVRNWFNLYFISTMFGIGAIGLTIGTFAVAYFAIYRKAAYLS